MKTIFTLAIALFVGQAAYAQGCTDLFISEYCEGSGNNKGYEIYNPTPDAIDLGPYVMERWSNGAQASSDETNLVGIIPAYGTWVVVNGQTEDVDLGGGQISDAVDPMMQILADQLDNPYPAPTYMNGNDALVFIKNGSTVVDIFGKPGEDPGTAWTDNEEAGYTSDDGGTWLTANHTLRRKYDITAGVTVPPTAFYALAEWDSLPSNTWDGLGSHACACDPNSVASIEIPVEFTLFPNPVTEGEFQINSNLNIDKINIYDQNGRIVLSIVPEMNVMQQVITTDDLEAGMYIVNTLLAGNRAFSQRVVVR
ncbi:MAG: T9SS type A sorting domain-containing protein [Flavobacteriales bacterium]|nr:T9SS type A sorting domain-containing protein [Flavobacteriales bacterium]